MQRGCNGETEFLFFSSQAAMLLEIWEQMRLDQEEGYERKSGGASNPPPPPQLAEPPGAREKIVQEILFLVEHLRQKSAERGR